jgi:hypothetical protein
MSDQLPEDVKEALREAVDPVGYRKDKEIERLRKCCAQRGARMQIMREWMNGTTKRSWHSEWWYFCEERPEARKWFDEHGVPVDAARENKDA